MQRQKHAVTADGPPDGVRYDDAAVSPGASGSLAVRTLLAECGDVVRIPLFQRIGKLRRDEPRLHAVADEIVRILVDLLRPFLELRVLCLEKLRRRLGIVRRHVVPEYRLQALLFHNSPLPLQLQRVGRALRYGRKARRLAVVRRKIDLVRRLAHDR